MRVLFVNTFDQGGGAARVVTDLKAGVRAAGHDAQLCVGVRRGQDEQVTELAAGVHGTLWQRPWRKAEVVLRRRGHRGAAKVAYAVSALGPRRFPQLLRGVEDFDYPDSGEVLPMAAAADIVHAHNLHGRYFDLRLLPRLSEKVPIILTLHDAWLLSGHCAHSFDCERWVSGCGSCPYLGTYPEILRDRTHWNWMRKRQIIANSELHVVTPSAWLMEKVSRSMLGVPAKRRRIIPNGVDLAAFRPGDRAEARAVVGLPQTGFVALFVGDGSRSNTFKDYRTLRAALPLLQTGSQKVKIVCIGKESAPICETGGTLIHLPPVASDRIAAWYRAADVYVHAARADTFPTAVLEALACGVPVIGSAVGGVPEQVIEGQTGRLVRPGDPEHLSVVLGQLADDPSARARMGAAAARAAQRRFDRQLMVQRYLDWYEEILAARRTEAPSTMEPTT